MFFVISEYTILKFFIYPQTKIYKAVKSVAFSQTEPLTIISNTTLTIVCNQNHGDLIQNLFGFSVFFSRMLQQAPIGLCTKGQT